MKRVLSLVLIMVLLLSCLLIVPVSAAKAETTRSIAIVFDNSGSMYVKGEKAWCRATYAMEVFASMLNEGDSLFVHPMHPIEVKGQKYTMDSPLVITAPSQAEQIRNIYTAEAWGTPIETIDAAMKGLASAQTKEKYMIVLTDGQAFYENDKELSVADTKRKLAEKFNAGIAQNLNVLYLGIGSKVAMPEMNSEKYTGEKASDSKDVLSKLTMMCNKIFARDTLPKSHISGNTIDFDISLSKLIVFVQGENVSDVNVVGKNGGTATLAGSAKTQYGSAGAGNYKKSGESSVDTSLQGMLVTYTDCSVGSYDISYSGKASNVEVYYEPDADLDFVFTDSEGNLVDPEALYKGDYKVQFGLKDAKTGELISSDLLGSPNYEGKYIINGEEHAIKSSGQSGEVPVSLDVGDTFTAELTASYLNGYSITKTAKDFGWPDGELKVSAKPAGDVRLEITGGDKVYDLQNLEQSGTYTAKVFYKGNQLTGTELEKVDLKWEPEKSNAEILKEFKDDHYALSLHYKNPQDPLSTKLGKCTVTIYAYYTEDGSSETSGAAPLTYVIEDNVIIPELMLSVPQSHFVISKIDEGESIKAYVSSKGAKLTPEEFKKLEINVDSEGLGHKITPLPEESAYEIKLNSTGKVEKGAYKITVTVNQKDNLGRATSVEKACKVNLSNMPLWLIWLIWILVILAVIFIIYKICHIKCLPKLSTSKNICEFTIGGVDMKPQGATFDAKIENKVLSVVAKYGGAIKTGISMSVEPGDNAYLITPQKNRKVLVKATSVKKTGTENVDKVTVGTTQYTMDPDTFKLAPTVSTTKDFDIRAGAIIRYSGELQFDGSKQDFNVSIKLKCKK